MEEYAYQPNTAAIVESFDTVRDLPAHEIPEGATGVGPVDWPAEAPGLRTALREFYARCDEVAVDLFRAIASVCCMEEVETARVAERVRTAAAESVAAEGHVDERADNAAGLARFFLRSFGPTSHCSMRAMRYPGTDSDEFKAHAGELKDVSFRAGKRGRTPPPPRRSKGGNGLSVEAVGISEHTDFECFTILHQTAPGLELKDLAGNWRVADVYRDQSKFTIIIADMMERWTNGWLRATPHRVGLAAHERLSLVRFNGLDPDASVAPLLRFTGAGASGSSSDTS